MVKDGSDRYDRNTYVKFDLSGIHPPVQRAILRITVVDLTNGVPAPLYLFGIDNDSWDEGTITWNNRPPVEIPPIVSVNVDQVGVYEFDVTDYINQQLNNDAVATLVLSDENTARRKVRLWSREGTAPPQLELKFGP